jgi:glutathione S-transferase
MYEVYWGSGSPYSWRVLLSLTIKGVPYESKLLQFSRGDHKAPSFLAMNPRGRVPVLKDGDLVVYESIAILSYIEKQHPAPPLFGETPAEVAAIWQVVSEVEGYLSPLQEELVATVLGDRTAGREEQVKAVADQVRSEMALYDKRLAARPYLAGPSLTAADIVLYPALMLIGRIGTRPSALSIGLELDNLRAENPNVDRWARSIENLPGYDATYPPHWRG